MVVGAVIVLSCVWSLRWGPGLEASTTLIVVVVEPSDQHYLGKGYAKSDWILTFLFSNLSSGACNPPAQPLFL
ncbi:unnamed protein product [Coffea canephora]|uniref:Secreted protein n=1 Tax=Coffea canephora TaxID=49390 RepID=A0A068UZN8_COFCA|nr:unnamed protein product [Coffea canephora]